MIAFALCVWAFIKEIFAGRKLKYPYKDEDSEAQTLPTKVVGGLISRLQKSRRLIAALCLALMLSLFINYKAISKLVVIARANEEYIEPAQTPPVREKPDQPMMPRKPNKTSKETIIFLENLYGVKQ